MQVSQSLITFPFRYPIAHCSKDWGYAYLTLWFRQQASTHMGHKGDLFLEAKFNIDGILSCILVVLLSCCLFFFAYPDVPQILT